MSKVDSEKSNVENINFNKYTHSIFIAEDVRKAKLYSYSEDMFGILFDLKNNFHRRYKHLSEKELSDISPFDVINDMMEEIGDFPIDELS